jgi:GTPase SAR1 family protein
VDNLLSDPARVVILGPGGIGKTTLVVTALHSTRVVENYPTRYFIACDSVQTINSLVAIASHLGLEGSKSSMRHIIHLTMQPLTLLILDNFETPWEPADGRVKIEEFLALLTDIPHVALLVRHLLICRVDPNSFLLDHDPAKFNGPIHSCIH